MAILLASRMPLAFSYITRLSPGSNSLFLIQLRRTNSCISNSRQFSHSFSPQSIPTQPPITTASKMASSDILSQTLSSITTIKLEELSNQRSNYEEAKAELLQAV